MVPYDSILALAMITWQKTDFFSYEGHKIPLKLVTLAVGVLDTPLSKTINNSIWARDCPSVSSW